MKNTKVLSALFLISVLFVSTFAMAQRGNGNRGDQNKQRVNAQERMAYLDLTQDQQDQIKTLFAEMQDKTTPLRLDVQAKKIELDKLMIADNPDEKAIMAKAEEMSDIQLEMQKMRLSNKLKMRALLTDEQKSLFDARSTGKKRGKKGNGMRGGDQRRCN